MSSTREGLHAWGAGRKSDPNESAATPPWVPAASKCSATARADPRQRGCSLAALVEPRDLAHQLSSTKQKNTQYEMGTACITASISCQDTTRNAGYYYVYDRGAAGYTSLTAHCVQHST